MDPEKQKRYNRENGLCRGAERWIIQKLRI